MKKLVVTYCFVFFLIEKCSLAQTNAEIQRSYLSEELSENEFDRNQWRKETEGLKYLREDLGENKFDREKWEKATDELDYSDPRSKQEETKPQESRSTKEPSGAGGSLPQPLLVAVFVIALATLIFFLLRAFGVNIFIRKKEDKEKIFALENFSDAIPESELERWLREALQKNDFRLAVRIYYLMIIRELAERKWINWKKEKTNYDYILEMNRSEHRNAFGDVTRIFERAWYGEHKIDAQNFHEAGRKLSAFISLVKNSGK